MDKKLFIASVILVTLLFGLIFWKVNETERLQPNDKDSRNAAIKEATVIEQKVVAAKRQEETILPESESKPERAEQKQLQPQQAEVEVTEQIAPPAFGFLPRGETVQVVGLLSVHDKNGSLIAYIDQLCKSRACERDISYQADILDAKWQESIVAILKLFQEGGVKNGSFFIEANRIKLEGEATDEKSALALQNAFASLKAGGMDVENHIAIDTFLKKAQEKLAQQPTQKDRKSVIAQSKTAEKNVTDMAEKGEATLLKKRIETETTQKQLEVKREEKIVSEVKKEEKPQVEVETKEAPAVENIKTVTPAVRKPKSIVKAVEKKRRETSKAVKKHIVKKRAIKTKKAKTELKRVKRVAEDIIAPSYMETSIDLNRKMAKDRVYTHAESREKKRDDLVAEPKLEILH
jgi:hypothetical protein